MTAAAPKTRIPWDGDAATPEGQTSIAVLLEWLGAPGNSDRWRFGGVQHSDGRGGRSALGPHFSKIELAREVLQELETHGLTHRLARDVRWKINALLRSYTTAAQFLAKYEQQKRDVLRQAPDVLEARRTIESSESRVMTHVYTLCPYFDALHPVLDGDVSDLQPPASIKIKREATNAAALCRSAVSTHTDGVDDVDVVAAELSDDDDDDDDDDDNRSSPRDLFVAISCTRKRGDMDDTDADDDEDSNGSTDALHRGSARHQRRLQADAQFTLRRRALVLKNLEMDIQIKRLQLERETLLLSKERALSRQQLHDAGVAVSDAESTVASHSVQQPQC